MTMPDPELRRAFLSSTYGTPAERVWLSETPTASKPPSWAQGEWGIVTAWNPAGKPSDPTTNSRRQAKLQSCVTTRGWTYQPGHNGEDEWLEPTLIIQQISQVELAELGRAFGQAAVVHGHLGQASLLWLDQQSVYATDRYWLTPCPPRNQRA